MDYKTRLFTRICFTIGGLITTILVLLSLTSIGQAITISQVFRGLLVWGMFIFMGYAVSFQDTRIYRRRVAHPVDPERLTSGQTCYLNGLTRIVFVEDCQAGLKFYWPGRGEFTGRPDDFEYLPHDKVSAYVSHDREVNQL